MVAFDKNEKMNDIFIRELRAYLQYNIYPLASCGPAGSTLLLNNWLV